MGLYDIETFSNYNRLRPSEGDLAYNKSVIMIVKIEPAEAMIGMYITSFRANWFSHPFWRSSFVVTSQKELDRIVEVGVPICIDTSKGIGPPSQTSKSRGFSYVRTASNRPKPLAKLRHRASALQFGQADRACAVALARRSEKVVKAMFDECRLGRSIPVQQLLAVVDEISEALERDGATFLAVTRLKAKDDYTYTHSVSVCALMISLGRRNKYDTARVRDLGMAGLLHDIGKLRIADTVLKKPDRLTADELEEMRRHPVYGHEMLLASHDIPAVALDVCLHHHERLDGSGYPNGLSGDAISEAVRISSICDVYDAMTSTRPYRKGLAPSEAIAQLDAMYGHFDPKLLFELMIGVGVYPAGMLVRLRSNRLGLALPSKSKTARTVFRAFYSTTDTQFIPYQDVTPGETLADDQPVSREDPTAWFSNEWSVMTDRINRTLPAIS